MRKKSKTESADRHPRSCRPKLVADRLVGASQTASGWCSRKGKGKRYGNVKVGVLLFVLTITLIGSRENHSQDHQLGNPVSQPLGTDMEMRILGDAAMLVPESRCSFEMANGLVLPQLNSCNCKRFVKLDSLV